MSFGPRSTFARRARVRVVRMPIALALTTWWATGEAHAQEPADAADGKSVAVMPLDVVGEMSEFEQQQAGSQIEANLNIETIAVTGPGDVAPTLGEMGVSTCQDAACISTIASRHDADYVIAPTVDASTENEYTVALQLFDGSNGESIESFGDSCTICGQAEMVRMVREATLDLASKLKRLENLEEAPEPEPEPEPKPKPEPVPSPPTTNVVVPRSPLVVAGSVMIGTGAASTIGGVTLIIMHRRSAGCLDDPRGGDCLPVRYTTILPGAILAGVGVAVLGTGIGLLVAGKKKQDQEVEKAEQAWIRPSFGPNSVALYGRF